jgi:hypothetical protein
MSKQSTTEKTSGMASVRRFFQSLSVEQIIIGGTVGVTVVIIVGIGLAAYLNRQVDIDTVERVFVSRPTHDGDVEHDEVGLPSAGGSHAEAWLNCGIYDEVVPEDNAVHALEHGAIWITYHPDLPEDDVEILRAIANGNDRLILSPYPELAAPIVVTAWKYRLRLSNANDSTLEQFIHNYQDGEEAPEPGASCSSGIGTPITVS